jgi:hypothetical protein
MAKMPEFLHILPNLEKREIGENQEFFIGFFHFQAFHFSL